MPYMLTVDRIENNCVICEGANRECCQIPLNELPHGIREGDVLRHTGNGYILDQEETMRRRAANHDLFNQLLLRQKKADPPGPQNRTTDI